MKAVAECRANCCVGPRCDRRSTRQLALGSGARRSASLAGRLPSWSAALASDRGSTRRFGVQSDPIHHVYLANAVTVAYSAIEELGLEVCASSQNPSRMPDGTWNPVVKADLEQRLQNSSIDTSDTHIWTLRGPKTRIEKKRPPPLAGKPSWLRGNVRDVDVRLIDALALASRLRSGTTTTHRFSDTARSLTIYDAHNVQSLARHLSWASLAFGRREQSLHCKRNGPSYFPAQN